MHGWWPQVRERQKPMAGDQSHYWHARGGLSQVLVNQSVDRDLDSDQRAVTGQVTVTVRYTAPMLPLRNIKEKQTERDYCF